MSHTLITVGPNDKLRSAADLMKLGRARHMPVVDDDGDLVGIVSQRDLFHNALLKALGYGARGAEKLMSLFLIKEAMTSNVITIDSEAALSEAAALMLEHRIGCLPVVDDANGLVGILTETDFLALHVEDRAAHGED